MEPSPPPCCETYEQIKELDGTRVSLVGTYRKVAVTKRPGKRPPPDPTTPGNVQIHTEGGSGIMLEVYYEAAGVRSAEEINKFHDRRVEVIGVIHQVTPTMYSDDGHELQTMIGPYIGSIESIELDE